MPAGMYAVRGEEKKELPRYLIFDTESVPDGRLLNLVKYPDLELSPEAAIERAQAEARAQSARDSDFLPVTFQIPVAVCALSVGKNYEPKEIRCLGTPGFETGDIVCQFWTRLARLHELIEQERGRLTMVTFNGRGFDWPLLELAAFRYGCSAKSHLLKNRNRYQGDHLDLLEWLTNFGAYRLTGGLNLLSKILGKPGKMDVAGHQVYSLYQAGKKQAINDYCLFDTLDTYFVFLRIQVLQGNLTLEREQQLVREEAKAWLASKISDFPALQQYLDNWGDWQPWP